MLYQYWQHYYTTQGYGGGGRGNCTGTKRWMVKRCPGNSNTRRSVQQHQTKTMINNKRHLVVSPRRAALISFVSITLFFVHLTLPPLSQVCAHPFGTLLAYSCTHIDVPWRGGSGDQHPTHLHNIDTIRSSPAAYVLSPSATDTTSKQQTTDVPIFRTHYVVSLTTSPYFPKVDNFWESRGCLYVHNLVIPPQKHLTTSLAALAT